MSNARLEEMLADSGLAPPEREELAGLLAPLARSVDRAPEPTAELSALFGGTTRGGRILRLVPDGVAVRRWRVRTASVAAVVLAVSSVGATGLSAAANTLPTAVQHHVSQFSRHYLPFDFPEPEEDTDQPLGQGRFALAPETSLAPGVDRATGGAEGLASGVVGAEPPRVLEGDAGRSSTTGPFVVAPRPADPGRQDVRRPGHAGYAMPSAAPTPIPSASPSETPSEDLGDEEPAGRPATLAPSPTASPEARPDKGASHAPGGASKPGASELPIAGPRPDKSPGTSPDSGSGTDSGPGSIPGEGQADGKGDLKGGDGSGDPERAPTAPDPTSLVPDLPDLRDLPVLPVAP